MRAPTQRARRYARPGQRCRRRHPGRSMGKHSPLVKRQPPTCSHPAPLAGPMSRRDKRRTYTTLSTIRAVRTDSPRPTTTIVVVVVVWLLAGSNEGAAPEYHHNMTESERFDRLGIESNQQDVLPRRIGQ
uniref:DUF1127 domain-containing protein n=1 Tax=Plectus sambesii TaxID=2011161 RepID=A0A914VDA2_9BILA